MPAEKRRQFWPDAAIMVAEFRRGMLPAKRLSIAAIDNVIFDSLGDFMR
jgi:hypothetical protein